jgi:HSP20 family molecular chaperone IbpA
VNENEPRNRSSQIAGVYGLNRLAPHHLEKCTFKLNQRIKSTKVSTMPPNYSVINGEAEVVLEVELPTVESAAELDCDLEEDFLFVLTWGTEPSGELEADRCLSIQLVAVEEPTSCRFDRCA